MKYSGVSKREFFQTLLFFTLIIFGILIITGTLTSGLHLVDDHEFIRFTTEMQEDNISVWDLIKKENKRDAGYRYRPLYYPVRVVQAAVFGTNFFGLSVLKGIEVVFTAIILYLLARKLQCSVKYALITVGIVMVGPQSAIWWKLGTPELTTTWVFGLAVLSVLKWKESKKWQYHAAVITTMMFASLYKENYVLLIPLIMLLYIYCSLEDQKITWKTFWGAIKENLFIEVLLGCYALWNLWKIVSGVGINAPGYVGIDTSMSLWMYIKVFLNNFRLHLRIGQYGFFVLAFLITFRKSLWELMKEMRWQILLALMIILPQMVMYAKTGLEERYVIPWVYGVAYLFVVVFSKNTILVEKKRKIYDVLLVVLLGINFILVCYEGCYFTYRGKGIERMFREVVELSDEDTGILSAFAPYDESDKTTSYLLHTHGFSQVYVYRDGECRDWYREGKDQTISLEDVDIIMTYNEKDRHFVKAPDIDFSEFEIKDFNTMRIAIRK